jgi:hypothetical protein
MLRLVAFAAFTTVLAACGGTVEESATPQPARQLDSLASRSLVPRGATEAADGRSAFAFVDGAVRRYSTVTGKVVRTYPLDGVWELTGISATGEWLALQRGDTEVLVLDAEAGTEVKRVRLDGDFRVEAVSARATSSSCSRTSSTGATPCAGTTSPPARCSKDRSAARARPSACRETRARSSPRPTAAGC